MRIKLNPALALVPTRRIVRAGLSGNIVPLDPVAPASSYLILNDTDRLLLNGTDLLIVSA